MDQPPKTEGSSVLARKIERHIKQGYRVVSRTDTSAQLVRPKKVGRLRSLFSSGSQNQEETVSLELTADGEVQRTKNGQLIKKKRQR